MYIHEAKRAFRDIFAQCCKEIHLGDKLDLFVCRNTASHSGTSVQNWKFVSKRLRFNQVMLIITKCKHSGKVCFTNRPSPSCRHTRGIKIIALNNFNYI